MAHPQGSLARGAVGTGVSTVLSLSSTAPAYSLAVTVGLLVALVGDLSPLLLLGSAAPVVLVVLCFARLNDAEPDCGTCFAWTTRAFGPRVGWLTGWVAVGACVLVMANLVQVAAVYAYDLVGAASLADDRWAQAALGLLLLGVVAGLAQHGIVLTARVQVVLFLAEVAALVWFAGRALAATPLPAPADAGTAVDPSGVGLSAWSAAFLVAVFLFWGWDSSFAVNEESDDPRRTPARSALVAVAILAAVYAVFAWAVVSWAGADRLAAVGEDDLFAELGTALVGSTGGKVLVGAVLVSALASAQTTILPSARAAFSMARRGAMPGRLAVVTTGGSPSAATWAFTALSAAVYVVLVLTSESVLADSVAATAVLVATYYALTCAAVPFHDRAAARREPVRRVVVPLLTAALFSAVLVLAVRDAAAATLGAVGVVLAVGVVGVLRYARPGRPTDLPVNPRPGSAERTRP